MKQALFYFFAPIIVLTIIVWTIGSRLDTPTLNTPKDVNDWYRDNPSSSYIVSSSSSSINWDIPTVLEDPDYKDPYVSAASSPIKSIEPVIEEKAYRPPYRFNQFTKPSSWSSRSSSARPSSASSASSASSSSTSSRPSYCSSTDDSWLAIYKTQAEKDSAKRARAKRCR